jgi:hypothetical protein
VSARRPRSLSLALALALAAAPLGAQTADSAAALAAPAAPAAAAPAAPMVTAAPAALIAPARATAELGQEQAALQARANGFSQNQILMIVGGAALLTGLIIGDDAGTVLAVGGAGVGLYGLYRYLQGR